MHGISCNILKSLSPEFMHDHIRFYFHVSNYANYFLIVFIYIAPFMCTVPFNEFNICLQVKGPARRSVLCFPNRQYAHDEQSLDFALFGLFALRLVFLRHALCFFSAYSFADL